MVSKLFQINLISTMDNVDILCFVTVSAPKRFYKDTNVLYSGNSQYEITLDNRKLKTPNGGPFVVRSEPLAIAVAAEWNAQKEHIDRSTMHLVVNV